VQTNSIVRLEVSWADVPHRRSPGPVSWPTPLCFQMI